MQKKEEAADKESNGEFEAEDKQDCDSKEYLEEVDVKEIAASVDEDSRIEVDDKLTKTQPLRIKIKLVTTNVNPVKQETTFGKDETPERGDFKLSGV